MEREESIMIIMFINLKENIIMGKDGMEKDIIIQEKKFLKLKMEKEMGEYIIMKVICYLKVNILMELEMGKEKNITIILKLCLKENISMVKK